MTFKQHFNLLNLKGYIVKLLSNHADCGVLSKTDGKLYFTVVGSKFSNMEVTERQKYVWEVLKHLKKDELNSVGAIYVCSPDESVGLITQEGTWETFQKED